LGWLYIDREQYSDAIESFCSAIKKNHEYFGNYWGLGKAQMALGQFHMAENALCMALEKVPEDLQPPASEEIPQLLQQCRTALDQSGGTNKGA
jgi:tetratricopeptide (TPR) repeat protein